jgi:hypothetical protein
VDSTGFALEGDSELAKDVLRFSRECLAPLKQAGVTPHLIDHQSKIIKGEKYSDKTAFGSVYKTNAVRSAFQIRGAWEENVLTATFAHKKNNFGPKSDDFTLEATFENTLDEGAKKGHIEIRRLPKPIANPDNEPTAKEKVEEAIKELGSATAKEVEIKTGLPLNTVKNRITDLKGAGALIDTGEKRDRQSVYECPNVPSYLGTGTGTDAEPMVKGIDEERVERARNALTQGNTPRKVLAQFHNNEQDLPAVAESVIRFYTPRGRVDVEEWLPAVNEAIAKIEEGEGSPEVSAPTRTPRTGSRSDGLYEPTTLGRSKSV